jgi:hypothetical protein
MQRRLAHEVRAEQHKPALAVEAPDARALVAWLRAAGFDVRLLVDEGAGHNPLATTNPVLGAQHLADWMQREVGPFALLVHASLMDDRPVWQYYVVSNAPQALRDAHAADMGVGALLDELECAAK